MKTTLWYLPAIWVMLILGSARAQTITFTTNTAIAVFNTNYDGADLVISNCTVTVDGPHVFDSLQIDAGGVLTHSIFANGADPFVFNVTNETQILSSTNPATLLNTNVALPVVVMDVGQDITYTNGVDYVAVPMPDGTTQLQWTNTSAIPDGSTVLVSYSWTEVVQAGLALTVSNNVEVAAGGSINVSGDGYTGGPGGGRNSGGQYADGSGGGYGGSGGNSASNAVGGSCYGLVAQPASLGSSGGSSYAGLGGAGGGLVQIVAGGTINVDGAILANGVNATNSRAGGGSGGSIWLAATNLSGGGSITANGGAGEPVRGGGGGGGRIAIQYGTNNFSGSLTAYGGSGWNTGGAGTIYTQVAGQPGFLLVDNGGQIGTNSTIALPSQAGVLIRGGAAVVSSGGWSAGNLTVASNSALMASAQTTLYLNVTGTLNVQAGGQITADGLGGAAGTGTGTGRFYSDGVYFPGSGGGYGGNGALALPTSFAGGASYGAITAPLTMGSGGGNYPPYSPGGNGGGGLQIVVTGPVQVDGRISANGSAGAGTGGGGGSGGGVSIYATSVAGSGLISANGGNGAGTIGGGGGGGRIAIISSTSTFAGTLSAAGGGGANLGGAGTIYLSLSSPATNQLVVDNAGHAGTNTPLLSLPNTGLLVRNGAIAASFSGATFASLALSSNAWLAAEGPNSEGGLSVTINGNATIPAGCGITANYAGFPAGSGAAGGYYASNPFPCGGGGNGGAGGNSTGNLALGGNTGESSVTAPYYAGGGGGNYSPYSIGGSGGGVVQFNVSGGLQLGGVISANGANGSGTGGGGGAGGSLNLSVGTLSGTGSITANGGNGVAAIGGGGGGGCIAIGCTSNWFGGTISAYGGGGANFGGAGTIYYRPVAGGHGAVVVDNAGHNGANTMTYSSTTTDFTLQNGAVAYAASYLSVGNLTVNSNAWLIVSNQISPETLSLSVSGNATIQGGGGIIADSGGYHSGLGSGAGGNYSIAPYYPGGGGGHGGYGASGFTNYTTTGGAAGFDSFMTPNQAGGGGGGASPNSVGGNGGGVIEMAVTGLLQVNGTLSANGGSGSGDGGGGGAGGSLSLNAGGLTGSGTIAANGGSGVGAIGGGGGGGVIAGVFASNLFSGTISASGGGGAGYGGAGTIYLQTNAPAAVLSALIVDNAGHRGTNTPLPYLSSTTGLILRNGAVVVQSASPQNLASLLITSNAWLVPNGNSPYSVNLTITGGATIQPGGGIVVDAASGSTQNSGSGHGSSSGQYPLYQGTGAGHGGYGGLSVSNSTLAGSAYDSSILPTLPGSSGGGFLPYSTGGAAGGYINLHVNGLLEVDGAISANGGGGSGSGGGGGSGGGINLNAGYLAGAGRISANGGNGALTYGGGGGGGRIALNFNSNSFAGVVSAYGGGGASYGGAGTIYYKTNSAGSGLVVLDNAGNTGTNTTFDNTTTDATIQNGAIGAFPVNGYWYMHNLLIRTNGTLTGPATTGGRTINANAITIDAGGLISLDGSGYGAQSGPGAGSSGYPVRGGGSHGGYGGADFIGGAAYDSIQLPTNAGSGGANAASGPPYSYGGFGGGALQLICPAITVNGRISAAGGNGGLNSGGGAGGSIFLPSVINFTGTGVVSTAGGSTTGTAGGGGGGRIAIVCTSNNFTGHLFVGGGNGQFPGGAGTIYTRVGGVSTVTVDNGGLSGTNTPLSSSYSPPTSPYNLNISGGAILIPLTPLPVLSNLTISAGSALTVPGSPASLDLAVLNNFNLTGSLSLDNKGYAQFNGPGPGLTSTNEGSGGGYGGAGGNAANGTPGGGSYGSATQPVNFGSGGGAGVDTVNGGSEGGGALRLSVGGTLTVNGSLSANGDYGWQDDSGGGAGGSLWIAANTLAGLGNISAAGGNGSLEDGGGGGGGRIAIYGPAAAFTGTINAAGGNGASPGQTGTIVLSPDQNEFQVSSQTPSGLTSNLVSGVSVTFDEAVSPASVSASAFSLNTPAGPLPPGSLSVSLSGLYTLSVAFPTQNLPGNYSLQVPASLLSVLGQPLTGGYTGGFTIALPVLSGTVTATNGAPVAGVLLQPDGGIPGGYTDTNGNYAFGVPLGWNGTVTPSLGTNMFVPGSIAYTNVATTLAGQNYLMVPTVAPVLASSVSGSNLTLNWQGIPGVTYQVMESADLVNWQPLGSALPGVNGPMQFSLPLGTDPGTYFLLSLTY